MNFIGLSMPLKSHTHTENGQMSAKEFLSEVSLWCFLETHQLIISILSSALFDYFLRIRGIAKNLTKTHPFVFNMKSLFIGCLNSSLIPRLGFDLVIHYCV